ncbi:MAG: hypothetical protein AcusKO_46000 [Acuticoccus sp.]
MPDRVLIHIHVPKCAGGAVNQVLRRHFGPRLLHGTRAEVETALAAGDGAADFDAIAAHMGWGAHRHLDRPALYFSAVRDPLARICSFFNHIHTQPKGALHRLFKARLRDLDSLSDADFERPPVRRRFSNAMCLMYSGLADIDDATWEDVRPLIEGRLDVGDLVVRDLAGITAFLEERGIHRGPLPKQKVTRLDRFDDYVVARPEALKPATVDRLCARNAMDLRLMDLLRKRGAVAETG